jgi:hypothetical protein
MLRLPSRFAGVILNFAPLFFHRSWRQLKPEALAAGLIGTGLAFARVGLEASPLSHWLHAGERLPVLRRQSTLFSRWIRAS